MAAPRLARYTQGMTTRRTVHKLVDELDESELELARQAIVEIRDEGFAVSESEEREILEREAECDRGERVDAREFLAALRTKG